MCPKGKRSLLACCTRFKCSIETTRNSVKVKLGINKVKVMKFWKSLISWELIVTDRGSECHLPFVRGRLHIEKIWRFKSYAQS